MKDDLKITEDELSRELCVAFADTPRPSAGRLVVPFPGDLERAEISDLYSRHTWQQVPTDLLLHESVALHFFTVEAFLYFLPAFLMSMLRSYDPEADMNDTVIWSLTYRPADASFREEQEGRFGAFSPGHGTAVLHFLEWLEERHGGDFTNPGTGMSDVEQAITGWWARYELK